MADIEAIQGQKVAVKYKAENIGGAGGDQDITLSRGGTTVATDSSVQIASGDSESAILLWNTAGVTPALYTLSAASDDDSDSISVRVRESGSIIDSFEDYANQSELFNTYTATSTTNDGKDDWEIQTAFVTEGAQNVAAEYNNGNPSIGAMPADGLQTTPQRGDTITVDFETTNFPNDTIVKLGIFMQSVGTDNPGDRYQLRIDQQNGKRVLRKLGGAGSTTVSQSPGLEADTHYRVRFITTSSEITAEFRDEDAGSLLWDLTLSDSEYDNGGINFGFSTGTSSSSEYVRFDNWRIDD